MDSESNDFIPKVTQGFHWVDYAVFALFIIASLGCGVYYVIIDKIRGQSAKGFMGGKRDMSVLPVTLSILSSLLSAIIITGTPAEIYTQGTMYFIMTVGMVLGALLTVKLFVPLFYPLKLISTNQVCFAFLVFIGLSDNNVFGNKTGLDL